MAEGLDTQETAQRFMETRIDLRNAKNEKVFDAALDEHLEASLDMIEVLTGGPIRSDIFLHYDQQKPERPEEDKVVTIAGVGGLDSGDTRLLVNVQLKNGDTPPLIGFIDFNSDENGNHITDWSYRSMAIPKGINTGQLFAYSVSDLAVNAILKESEKLGLGTPEQMQQLKETFGK